MTARTCLRCQTDELPSTPAAPGHVLCATHLAMGHAELFAAIAQDCCRACGHTRAPGDQLCAGCRESVQRAQTYVQQREPKRPGR